MYGADVAPECAAEFAAKYQGRYCFTAKKMGAQTAEANINAGLAAARQIVNFFEKGDTTFKAELRTGPGSLLLRHQRHPHEVPGVEVHAGPLPESSPPTASVSTGGSFSTSLTGRRRSRRLP